MHKIVVCQLSIYCVLINCHYDVVNILMICIPSTKFLGTPLNVHAQSYGQSINNIHAPGSLKFMGAVLFLKHQVFVTL